MKTLTASAIAEMVKGTILGDADKVITGVCGVRDATSDHLSFVGNKKYQHQLETTAAGIVLINQDLAKEPLNGRTFIVCENVDMAFAAVLEFFATYSAKNTEEFVSTFLSNESFFGQDLAKIPGLKDTVVLYLDDIKANGMREALCRISLK